MGKDLKIRVNLVISYHRDRNVFDWLSAIDERYRAEAIRRELHGGSSDREVRDKVDRREGPRSGAKGAELRGKSEEGTGSQGSETVKKPMGGLAEMLGESGADLPEVPVWKDS